MNFLPVRSFRTHLTTKVDQRREKICEKSFIATLLLKRHLLFITSTVENLKNGKRSDYKAVEIVFFTFELLILIRIFIYIP